MNILIIDNYDSFTYNLYQYVGEVGKTIPQVVYNDRLSWKQFKKMAPDGVIISPGPGSPTNKKDFGIAADIITRATVPILGVCLGHQGIGALFGARVVHAREVMHGRTSSIYHTGTGLFAGIPQGFTAVRYHSLILDPKSLPSCLEITATSQSLNPVGTSAEVGTEFSRSAIEVRNAFGSPSMGQDANSENSDSSPRLERVNIAIMGIRHRTRPLYGVQFHPESIRTEYGKALLANFLLAVVKQ